MKSICSYVTQIPENFQISDLLQKISAEKDVGAFHLYNVGGLVIGGKVLPTLHALWLRETARA
jgi:5,10-methylene-tetrahydrofolate dehydrogenase/methenyl tetrahydrofolate cyclohydrolase